MIKINATLAAWGDPDAINEIYRFMKIAGPKHGSTNAIKKEIERVKIEDPLPANKQIDKDFAKTYIDQLKQVNNDLSGVQEALEETADEDPMQKIDRLFRDK